MQYLNRTPQNIIGLWIILPYHMRTHISPSRHQVRVIFIRNTGIFHLILILLLYSSQLLFKTRMLHCRSKAEIQTFRQFFLASLLRTLSDVNMVIFHILEYSKFVMIRLQTINKYFYFHEFLYQRVWANLGKSDRRSSKLRKQTSNKPCDWLYLGNPGS